MAKVWLKVLSKYAKDEAVQLIQLICRSSWGFPPSVGHCDADHPWLPISQWVGISPVRPFEAQLQVRGRMLNWRQIRAYTHVATCSRCISINPYFINPESSVWIQESIHMDPKMPSDKTFQNDTRAKEMRRWRSCKSAWRLAELALLANCLVLTVLSLQFSLFELVCFSCTGWSQQEQGRGEHQEGFIILKWCTFFLRSSFQCDPSVLFRWCPVLLQRLHRWKQLGKSCRGSPAQVPHLQ